MESPKRVLRDLALIYIALAHGTDQNLDDAEMEIIVRRLQEVQAGVSQGTVLRAVKEALDDYTQDDARRRVDEAVQRLRVAVPQSLRRRILLDITEIGKADHKFLYKEAQYIGELIAAWKVNLTDLVAESATMWSILGPGAGDDGWTPVHDLMLIYVTLAHGADLTLSREEVEAIREKLGEWLPNADQGTVRRVLHDVMRVYQDEHERTFDEAVEAVKATVPAYQREAILEISHFAEATHGFPCEIPSSVDLPVSGHLQLRFSLRTAPIDHVEHSM